MNEMIEKINRLSKNCMEVSCGNKINKLEVFRDDEWNLENNGKYELATTLRNIVSSRKYLMIIVILLLLQKRLILFKNNKLGCFIYLNLLSERGQIQHATPLAYTLDVDRHSNTIAGSKRTFCVNYLLSGRLKAVIQGLKFNYSIF